MSRAKPSNITHSAVMSPETHNVLLLTGKIKDNKYKGYVVEIDNTVPLGKFYIMDNMYLVKIERGEHEKSN